MADHDESLALRRLTGGLLVAVPVAFTAIFVALGAAFNYPDILGAPTEEVLGRFAAGGDGLVALWYGFMLTAVGFVPIAVLLPRVLRLGGALAAASVVFGVLAGAVQFLGLARVKAGARLDARRRFLLAEPGRSPAASWAVKRFLQFYGPADSADFAEWSGVARPHAERLWDQVEGELSEVSVGRRKAWTLSEDLGDLESPPDADGVRFLPPGDPYLQKPNRRLIAPEAELRKRLFRPVASPGAVSAGREARRALAGQGKGKEGRGHRRDTRAGRLQGPRAGGTPRRRTSRRHGSPVSRRLNRRAR